MVDVAHSAAGSATEVLPAGAGGISRPALPRAAVALPRRRRHRRGGHRAVALVFLAPSLVLLGALVVYPIVATIVASLHDATGTRFVGLANYRQLFTNHQTLVAIRNNVVWVIVVPASVTAFGLVFAVLAERISFQRAFKTVIFMPMAISLLAGGIIWRVVYDQSPQRGMINAAIEAVVSVFSPPGQYTGATPSAGMQPDGNSLALTASVVPGQAYQLAVVGIAPGQVPNAATQAATPQVATDTQVAGVVFRDFQAGGGGQPGAVDPGELGLPGVKVDLQDAAGSVIKAATTAGDGSFLISGVPPGAYRLDLPSSNFRPAFQGVEWLGPTLITPSIIVAYIWIWAGFAMMVLASGLAALPREVIEAARVDGASEWHTFRRITVPLLRPEMVVVFITLVIYVLKVFDIVLAIAPEAVQNNADVIGLEMWRTAFGARNQGLGSAIAVLLFAMVLPVMLLNLRRFRQEGG